ncbi:Hypothetical protein, putative [Bodo saltans]|uniref:NYN domain-containing protein n=1 Tax=Bodo saltans TaxID=75058 RepID=A0A0S4KJX0_BODSA|nr:Hypothetical protein, putative [Bodo saltans]|eukprot:CUI14850.1 Hypothetical protein, putative [Bodo saltans]
MANALEVDPYELEPMSYGSAPPSPPQQQQVLPSTPQPAVTAPPPPPVASHVTVLWDFEQFSAWSAIDICRFHQSLLDRLTHTDHSLHVDHISVTAVGSDFRMAVDVLRQLNVRVSLVSRTSSHHAADVRAMEQAASNVQRNPGQATAQIVVITSRKELASMIQDLKVRGMRVLLVHNAMPGGDDATALEAHAFFSIQVSELLPHLTGVVEACVSSSAPSCGGGDTFTCSTSNHAASTVVLDAYVADGDYVDLEPMSSSSNASMFGPAATSPLPPPVPPSKVTVLWDFAPFSTWNSMDVEYFYTTLVDQLLRDDSLLQANHVSATAVGTNFKLSVDVLRQLGIRVSLLSSAKDADLRALEHAASEIVKNATQVTTEAVFITGRSDALTGTMRGLEDRGMKVLVVGHNSTPPAARNGSCGDATDPRKPSFATFTRSQRAISAEAYEQQDDDYEPMSLNNKSFTATSTPPAAAVPVAAAAVRPSKVAVLWDFAQFSAWSAGDIRSFFVNLQNKLMLDDPSLSVANISATAVGSDYKFAVDVLRQLSVRVSFVKSAPEAYLKSLEHAAADVVKNATQVATEAVVITSRTELGPMMRSLEDRGVRVLLVHNVMPGSADANALELHPAHTMQVSELLPRLVVDACVVVKEKCAA